MKTSSIALPAAVALALSACTHPSTNPTPASGERFDVIIENGRVVDGTGAAWYYGDVGIRGDRIAAVTPRGLLRNAAATTRVDARNMVVAPGFIDIQDQSGGQLLLGDGRQLGKITQGVTTGILGEGSTPAPLNQANLPPDAERAAATFRATARIRRMAERHGGAPHLAERRVVRGRRHDSPIRNGRADGRRRPARRSTRCAARCAARWRTARSAWRAR